MPPITIKSGYVSTAAALDEALRPEGLSARLGYDGNGYFTSLTGLYIVTETKTPRGFLFWHWSTTCTRRIAKIIVFPDSPVQGGSGDRVEIVVQDGGVH